MPGTAVHVIDLTKVFPDGRAALRGVSFDVHPGEWLALVGPSGCGKTTTLRILAGLESPTGGTVHLRGQNATSLPPWQRDVAMVFQRPALAATRTVLQNLTLGLAETETNKAKEVADWLGLGPELGRYPHQLSGGQQQRVALGRALARGTSLCLLDEPLGQLDAPLRDQLRRELHLLHRRTHATIISVTHDPREAWALGQRVAVMNGGIMEQIAEPEELYCRPINRFVAEFFTANPMNFCEGFAQTKGSSIQWQGNGWRRELPWPDCPAEGSVVLGVRAEDVSVQALTSTSFVDWRMQVEFIERQPEGAWVTGTASGSRITGWMPTPAQVQSGDIVEWNMNLKRAYLFDGSTGRTLRSPG